MVVAERGCQNGRESEAVGVHMEAKHLESYMLGQLPKEASATVESHLMACVACGIELEETSASIGHWAADVESDERARRENRTSPRLPTDDPAVMTVLRPERSSHMETTVLDASKEGLKLRVPLELLRGAIVQVHVRDLFILAEVRYCRPVGATFYAGVLIQDVFPAAG